MRVGLLADPRMHLAGAAFAIGAFALSPNLGGAVESARLAAVGSLDRLGLATGRAIGLDGFDGRPPRGEEYSYYTRLDAQLSAEAARGPRRY